LYVINLDDVSLFVDSSITFLTMLNYVLYQIESMNIVLLLSKKKKSHNCFQNKQNSF